MSLNLIASAASSVAHLVSPTANEAHSPLGHSFDAVALKPQPLPPREFPTGSLFGRFDAVALNPQPLPPRELGFDALRSRFDAVALNPQPLPPRELGLNALRSRFDAVALNPQPLPPREVLTLGARIALAADEQCGTAPRWLHHLPPPPPLLGPAQR